MTAVKSPVTHENWNNYILTTYIRLNENTLLQTYEVILICIYASCEIAQDLVLCFMLFATYAKRVCSPLYILFKGGLIQTYLRLAPYVTSPNVLYYLPSKRRFYCECILIVFLAQQKEMFFCIRLDMKASSNLWSLLRSLYCRLP